MKGATMKNLSRELSAPSAESFALLSPRAVWIVGKSRIANQAMFCER